MTESIMFSGSIAALVTPMDEGGGIDYDAVARLLDWHVESGTSGVVAVGTTGESPTLDVKEHLDFIAKVIELAKGRIKVIAGTGANSTAEAVRLTSEACASGADGCLSVVPYYNKPPQEGLLRHFEAVADAADKPVIVYNVPGRTITDLADETLEALSKHPMIMGVKDATGDIGRLRNQLGRISREGFSFLSGDDATSLDYILAGGHGVISVTANIAPSMMAEMVASARASDRAKAEESMGQLAAFNAVQAVEANPIPLKWAMHDAGLIGPGIRLPLVQLSEAHRESVAAAARGLK